MQGKYGLPPVFIKFYWNTSMPICLHVIYGCFCKTQGQSWVVATETVRSAEYKIFVFWSGPLRKSLLTSGLGNSYFSGLNPEMRNTNPGVVISLGNYLSHFTIDTFSHLQHNKSYVLGTCIPDTVLTALLLINEQQIHSFNSGKNRGKWMIIPMKQMRKLRERG